METKVLSKYHRQDEFLMSSGKKIFIERTFNKGSCELLHNSLVKLLKLATDKPEFPRGYKFSWIAFNRDNPSERILFDNHTSKGSHWHENGHQEYFTWVSRKQTQQLFYQKIIQKFGNFIHKL